LIFSFVFWVGGDLILKLLTNDPATIHAAGPFMFWVVLIPAITFAAFIWDGIYVGATASKAMRNSMVIITTIIFLPTYYLLEPALGNNGLWLAMMLFMGARGVFLTVMAPKSVYISCAHG
jgi:MATE family multidrug resistance protein